MFDDVPVCEAEIATLHEPPKETLLDSERNRDKEVAMQGSTLYVGNLGLSVTAEQVRELFAGHGEVKEVRLISGRDFGFVEMASNSDAENAQQALNGSEFEGRSLKVDEARPRRSEPSMGGYGGGPRSRGMGGGRRRY